MTDFRQQFDRAKKDYQSAHYPGDLAAIVLPTRMSRSRIVWRIAGPLAMAASVALAFGVLWPTAAPETKVAVVPPTTSPAILVATSQSISDDSTVAPIPANQTMPDSLSFPTELPTMPTGDSVSSFPSSPTMPGFNSTDSTTEKEPT